MTFFYKMACFKALNNLFLTFSTFLVLKRVEFFKIIIFYVKKIILRSPIYSSLKRKVTNVGGGKGVRDLKKQKNSKLPRKFYKNF